ncbi:MAG: GntR family transcriptional regulator [Clostridiaceae bacterium]|nr:GntR family transcriptional regulator [Bacillota bacterium]NLI39338.1 GntR family transcriptional regulator [Clostridiaceae bacterium]
MVDINKYSNVPLYCQLKNLILDKIEKGEFKADSKIPSEQDFCERYDISRPTVRQAINELTASGHLYKLKGKGTFVSTRKTHIHIKDYSGFTDSILDSKDPAEKNIVSMEITSSDKDKKLSELFGLKPDMPADFAAITYINNHGGEVISLNTSYIPLYHFPDICEDIKLKKPSHDILRGKYPLIPNTSKSVLEVIYTDQRDAAYLKVQPGQPLIRVNNILFAKNGQPVEYIVTKYRADKCLLSFENHK